MGCNSSTHTTAQDSTHGNSDCSGASTNGTAEEKAENDLDIECGAEAAAESSEALATESETNTLHTAAEPTPAEDQDHPSEAGALAADQSEQTGPDEAPGPSEELGGSQTA
ncbi:uncharacterized protein si:dkey-284p5.3 isoform X1 [Ictalurus furcatus]|uniref:uncharacterized protein si:dkey-284p5.3 isoform X1 n=1 Tax=Ictalurus furcatus TaxID=66913 RepID=UPI00235019CD|nr:uncharacterized protein si:dkey-284p5.3 isoform X1 [Ictalurus furcatus]